MTDKILLLDCDEVALQWVSAFETHVVNDLGFKPTRPLEGLYDLPNWMGISKDELHNICLDFNSSPDHFPYLKPFDDASEFLPKIVELGYRLHVITACVDNEETHKMRKHNLDTHFPNLIEKIHLVGALSPKSRFLEQYKPTYWVEDTWRHCIDGLNYNHTSIIITREHNKHETHSDIVRVDHWGQIYELVKFENN